MNPDETQELQLEADSTQPAPGSDATAAPEPETTEEPPVEQIAEEQPPRTYTQEELDEILGKRLARERRKLERELREQPAPTTPALPDDLTLDMFSTPEEYAMALAQRMTPQLAAEQAARHQQLAIEEAHAERVEAILDKYDDFEQVAYNPQLPVTDYMAQTIKASEAGPEVLYHLGLNPKEAARIAGLSPLLQAREIGKIEVALASAPPVKRTSTAPAPIEPVQARANGAIAYDTTDPRSIKSMSTSDWIEAERQRQIKKAEARR